MAVHETVLSLVGATPLVRLDRIACEEGLQCSLLAKCEYFNAGGSVKDRIALRMVEEAEAKGRLVPGVSVLVEASSGNTGVGLALVAAVKGYRCIITMPEKMSREKANTMAALGAEIIRTPTEAAHDSPLSNMGKARELLQSIPHAVMLDQYGNPDNPDAHFHGTGSEIVTDLAVPSPRPSSLRCDVFVAGAGTGGTLTGVARRLKEAHKDTVIVGVDPRGSILARPETLNTLKEGQNDQYKVEGIGYDFIPDVLKHRQIDHWVKVDDPEAFAHARRLIRNGLLCGGSCGSALAGALAFLRSDEGKHIAQDPKANVVILLADSIRNYITSPWLLESDSEPTKLAHGDRVI